MAEQSLKDKTVKGVGWSAIDNASQHVVSFIVSIVLARILSPDDYGLLGIIAIFTVICNTLISGGFSDALLRRNNVSDNDYNTAFVINFVLSLILYFVVFICSPLIASFFGREELVSLTRVSSLTMIIGALAIVQQTRLTKRIDFKTQTKISLIASITSGLVGIIMALWGFGVWALVAQGIMSQTLRTVLLWIYNKWIPRLIFSYESFKELFGFGWKMMLVAFINSLWKELYQVIIGKYYNPATLGQYTRANQFSQLFSNNLTNVVQRVSFPVLSEIQDNKTRMVAAYRRIIKTTMFITAVTMFALGAVSEPLIYCLIGEKWHEASTYLPLICVSASLFPLHAINLNMLEIQGRSDLFLGIEIVKKIILLFPLYVGAVFGIMPMLWVSIGTNFIAFLLNSFFTGKMLGYSSWMQLKDVVPSYTVASIVAVSVWFLKDLPLSNWIILPMQVIVGIVVFFMVCKVSKIEEYHEVKELALSLINKKR